MVASLELEDINVMSELARYYLVKEEREAAASLDVETDQAEESPFSSSFKEATSIAYGQAVVCRTRGIHETWY